MTHPDFDQWLSLQKEATTKKQLNKPLHIKKFVGDRGYLHFDGRVNIGRLKGKDAGDPAYRVLTSPEEVAKRGFLPFLRDDQRVKRFRDKPETTLEGNRRRHDQRFSTIKNRPIMFASHLDAAIFSLYSSILSKDYESFVSSSGIENNVIAYRAVPLGDTGRNKSNIDFASELYEVIKGFDGDAGILLLDISGFFDNLNHKRLYEKWRSTLGVKDLPSDHLAIYNNITKYRYVFTADAHKALGLDKESLKTMRKDRKSVLCSPADFNQKIKKQNLIHKNNSGKGIPQGSPISGLLANVYMSDFDVKVKALVNSLDGVYMRYSDDIAIVVDPKKLIGVYEKIQSLILEEQLRISTKKTDAFVYEKSQGKFYNVIRSLEPEDTLNLKRYPQYLGFVFTEEQMLVRANTLGRRFRGGKAFLLKSDRWAYFGLVNKKLGSVTIPHQIDSIRKKIKPLVTLAQKQRAERNRQRRGDANSI